MDLEQVKKIIMPQIDSYEAAKYIIYGTGEVAKLYCDEIVKRFGKEAIHYFVDGTNLVKKCMEEKIVLHYSELSTLCVNEYKYILATISKSADTMKIRLLEAGVYEENIMPVIPYFNTMDLKRSMENVEDIYILPEFKTHKELVRFWDDIKLNYGLDQATVKVHFMLHKVAEYDIWNEKNDNLFIHENRFECEDIEQNLFLVWDVQKLMDFARQFTKVYCIDDKFLFGVQNTMLRSIAELRGIGKSKGYYEQNSIYNFKLMREAARSKKAIGVFGIGPSLREGVEKQKDFLKETFNIVCNDMFKIEEVMNIICPNLYVLSDILYIRNLKEEMKKIVEYVETHNCFIGVFKDWIPTLINQYHVSESKIIGFEAVRDEVNFPDEHNMRVCTLGTVVLTLALSVGFALKDDVYVIACDGSKDMGKGTWNYAKGVYDNFDKLDTEDRVIGTITQRLNLAQFMPAVLKGYETMLEYARSKGKRWYTFTHSHFELLEENYIDTVTML